MSRACSLFQLWHSPPDTRLLLSLSKLSKGTYMIPSARTYPGLCFCKDLQTTAYEVVKGSYVPTSQIKQESKPEEKSPEKIEGVGAFQKLPMRIAPTKGIANIAKRERNRGAKQLDALMKELAVPLRTYSENFPNKKYLHPYE
ncbi:hypothetical protein M0R45_035545 [Rubus argutus]|uniref:NOG1 N-terminal helical domain-containing protein n=1 Tax=Rubus argutus TaxID=59490 RepID=A0AAW1VTF5_RUBAR